MSARWTDLDAFVATMKAFHAQGKCGTVQTPDGREQVLHLVNPGRGSCQCGKHLCAVRAAP